MKTKEVKKSKPRRKNKNGRPATFTVKIDGELHQELDSWLGLTNTRSMGYHSKSDFVNQAVREMMKRERGPRFTDLVENSDGDYTLIDTYLISSGNNILVTLDTTHKTIFCTYCKMTHCDHVLFMWKSVASSARLSNLGFSCVTPYKRYDHHV